MSATSTTDLDLGCERSLYHNADTKLVNTYKHGKFTYTIPMLAWRAGIPRVRGSGRTAACMSHFPLDDVNGVLRSACALHPDHDYIRLRLRLSVNRANAQRVVSLLY
ncbi:hypothetical protein RRG08_055470 [Elysia crispata]|uniref:Uncharacterized protein n=1 Tax=Elysia crispata TaxID=231223 RepID=A0AAE0YYZ2_9GAST|nr:hypothetical protein RRG08_055470 [Elysia crispata]